MSCRLGILFVAMFVLSGVAAAAEAPRPMTPVDMVEIRRLSDPALSPDGGKLLFRRSQTDWRENRVVQRYRLIDLNTGNDLPVFAYEDAKESVGRGVWAPDGSGFVTLLEREDDEHEQAYFFSVETGTLEALTSHDEDVSDVVWAPNGGHFYFSAERARSPERRLLLDDDWLIREYEDRPFREVWRFDLETRESTRVIGGDAYSVRRYALSRDGSKIIHMRAPGPLGDDVHNGDLWLFDIETGDEVRLTNNRYSEASPALSPDNGSFAFIATVNEDGEAYYEDNLFVQTVGEETPRLLMPDEAMEVLDFSWSQDGDGLFVLGNIGVRTELFHYSLSDDALTRLTEGDHVVGDWSYLPSLNAHTAIVTTAANPGEIFIKRDGTEGFEQISDEYDAWPERFTLPKQEAVQWRGRGRVTIEGLLVYPVDYEQGEAFPLVTITHGGPRSSSQFGSWNNSRHVPVLAGEGYGVFLPNHRGGTGYGDAFMRDMVGNYFNNAHHDILDGIDALIDRGLADPDRLVKMGWSAGGHMTNKLITVTDRFKAASSGAGAADWVSMYGESDVRHNRTPVFGGAPWERRAPLKSFHRQSMLKDAWRVTTPTLFFVGGDDVRVPPTQSILMYRGVKGAGAATELYVAPGQPHGFRKPSYRLFKIIRDLQWFARYVHDADYVATLPAIASEPKEEKEDEDECQCE